MEGLQEVVALLLLGSEPRLEAQLRISWERKGEGHSIPGSKKSLQGHPGSCFVKFQFPVCQRQRKSVSFATSAKVVRGKEPGKVLSGFFRKGSLFKL